jgi:5-methylcytosine-specific restriction protein B
MAGDNVSCVHEAASAEMIKHHSEIALFTANKVTDVAAIIVPARQGLDALNQRLRVHLPRDARSRQVGHAYLMPTPPMTSVPEFGRILRDEIVPLLQEYCADDFVTLQAILGKGLIDAEAATLRHGLFEPNREDDLVQAVLTGMEISGASVAASETISEPNAEQDGPADADGTA